MQISLSKPTSTKNSSLQITLRKWILPHPKERWQVLSSSRLLKFEQMDDSQQIPPAIDFRAHLQPSREMSLLKVQHSMGIQQHSH